jgi:SAM-dependent methyltransferase
MASCPDCGAMAENLGNIPAATMFAGVNLAKPILGGSLWRCTRCRLGFRWPRLKTSELNSLYERGADDNWSVSANQRLDWEIGYKTISDSVPIGGKILDIGCYDGRFLAPLQGKYACHGIEINSSAGVRAKEAGVTIVGTDCRNLTGRYDCVTAFDVIEHVESPKDFVASALETLHPRGIFIISTGNFDYKLFQYFGGAYWYCAIAEHISFLGTTWLHALPTKLPCEVLATRRFKYTSTSASKKITGLSLNAAYRFSPSLFVYLRKMGIGGIDIRQFPELTNSPPSWPGGFRDHVFVALRKV